MKTLNKIQFKKEIISNDLRGFGVYDKPFIFRITEDKKQFYYCETGVLVSARKYPNIDDYNKTFKGKYVVNVQYDYRSGDDLQNFGFVRNTGTYGINLFCKNLDDAIQKTLEFLESDFVDYRTFRGEKIEQKNIVSVREVAKSQSLHHLSSFIDHIEGDNLYLKLLKNCGEYETFLKYVEINKNRHLSDLKYMQKLKNRFKKDFDLELDFFINHFKFSLSSFIKKYDKELTPVQNYTIKKIIQYYN